MDTTNEVNGSESASNSEDGSRVDLIPCVGCVFCRTQFNPNTSFTSSVTGRQFTFDPHDMIEKTTCTTENVVYLITCKKCSMQYVGMTTNSIRTRFANRRSRIKNYKRQTLLYDHFCGAGHDIFYCLVQIIFHVDQDDKDTKDVLLAKEEYYMRMLATLYPFGLNDNINSLNINLRSYDFKKFNSLNTPYFSYPQTRQRRSHGHRKCNSQTTLDFIDFTSKIEDLFLAREHRALYALLRSVSHQYLKNTLCYFASEGRSIRLEVYHILHAFYSQYCKPNRVNPKHIVYFTLPFIHKLQEKINLSRILNNSAVKSNIPIAAKKFQIYVSYKYGPTIGESLFNYNKVLSTITKKSWWFACLWLHW